MVGDLVQEICSSRSSPEKQQDGGRRAVGVGMEEEEEVTTPSTALPVVHVMLYLYRMDLLHLYYLCVNFIA